MFLCDYCYEKFHRLDVDRTYYVEHQKRHSNSKTHLCPCGMKLYLERHIVIKTWTKRRNRLLVHRFWQTNETFKSTVGIHICMRSHNNRTGALSIDNGNKKVILYSICGKQWSLCNLAVHIWDVNLEKWQIFAKCVGKIIQGPLI